MFCRGFRKFAALAGSLLLLAVWGGNGRAAVAEGRGAKGAKKSAKSIVDESVLAEINGEKITVGQLRAAMKTLNARHQRQLLGEDQAKHILFRNLVSDRLVIRHMSASGVQDSADFKDRMEAIRTLGLGNYYLEVKAIDYTPSDNEVRRFLPQYWRTVDVRLFFGATREEAEKAREEVLEGKDFEKIVKERSVGPGAEKGGLQKGARFGGSYFPEHIDRLMFTQEAGWVSPIFEDDLGYCFVRLERARDFDPAEIEKISISARESAKNDARVRWVDEEYEKHSVKADRALLEELEGLPMKEWKGQLHKHLALVDGKPLYVKDFYWYLVVALSGDALDARSGQIRQFFEVFVKYRGFVEKALKEGFEQKEEVRSATKVSIENLLLGMFRDKIARNLKVTEKDAKEFFARNRDKLKKGEGRQVRLIAVGEEREAKEIAEQLRANPVSFPQVARTRSIDLSRKDRGDVGVVYRGQMEKEMDQPVFRAAEGEIVGPVLSGGKFYLFRVEKVTPPVTNPKYENYAKETMEYVRAEKLERALKEKRDELYRKASIVSFPDTLKQVAWVEDDRDAIPRSHHGR